MTSDPGRPDPERCDYDVVVVGGSLVGSAAALFLAHQGLRVVMVERRTSVSDHPRARGLSVRTMELFRAVGIEPEVRDDLINFATLYA